MKVCFYDANAFSTLTGFPFSPSWVFDCVGGVDITGQVSFAGTSQTTVTVSILGSSLPHGGFQPGDHVTVSIKMQFVLRGSALPSGYFGDGSDSDGAFKVFTDAATCAMEGVTGNGIASFKGYLQSQ